MTTTWIKTTEADYDDMFGVLPPAVMTAYGFLVGEPFNHRECTVRRVMSATYSAYVKVNGHYYVADEPLTVAEFRKFDPNDMSKGFDVS